MAEANLILENADPYRLKAARVNMLGLGKQSRVIVLGILSSQNVKGLREAPTRAQGLPSV